MANAWFRLYAEFANDPKMQMLSESDQRRFVMVLCIRCSNDDVTLQDEEVAFQLRISNDEWSKTKAVFLSRNLITDDNKPTAWEKRQFISDSSAPRVAKHRALKKQSSNDDVTLQKPKSNAVDSDTDSDKERTKPSSAPPVGFADFWIAYPKKKSKGAAEKVWKRIKPDLKTVLSAIERAKTSADWLKEQGQFIPHPATWLNAKGWEDECTPASASNTGGFKPWYMAASTIEKEAERLNIEKLSGELFPVFKARVFKAAGVTEEMLRAANSDFGARA